MELRTIIAASGGLSLAFAAIAAIAGDTSPPPGPIAPTFKTLTEVEPRIAINATNTPGDSDATPSIFKITQPGSYYLTGNLTGQAGKIGIEIAASDVTIDLNGFALLGVPGSSSGIRASVSASGVAVRNGTIRAWGANGVDLTNAGATRIEALTAVDNVWTGIRAGEDCVVTSCVARGNIGYGIVGGTGARLSDCNAAQNGGAGLYALDGTTISGCTARNNGDVGIGVNGTATFLNCVSIGNTGSGFICGYASTYNGCSARDNQGHGFWVNVSSSATNCSASENSLDGFLVWSGSVSNCVAAQNGRDGIRLDLVRCSATGNLCEGNGASESGAGVRATSSTCRIDSNQVSSNDFGIVAVADCVVVRNSARSNNSSNYSFPAGSDYAQVISNPGNGFVSTNPWANFAY